MSAIRRIDAGWAMRVASVASLVAQQATSAIYRPPTLVLVYPAPGVSVPGDNATVVFHYAVGDASDPLDLRSFRVLVDGVDRTSHFRVTADAAWGTIVQSAVAGVRARDVRAHICSVRGVCVSANAIVPVVGTPSAKGTQPSKERRGRIVDVLLEMARRLLKP